MSVYGGVGGVCGWASGTCKGPRARVSRDWLGAAAAAAHPPRHTDPLQLFTLLGTTYSFVMEQLKMDCEQSRQGYLSTLRSFMQHSNETITNFVHSIGSTSLTKNHAEIHKDAEVQEAESINIYSDEPLLPSAPVPPALAKFAVIIDADKQRSILLPYKRNAVCMRIPSALDLRQPPASAGELTANFTKEERLALYEYTLKNAAPVAAPPELLPVEAAGSSKSHPKELSGLELKKAMRDLKRRRQAYRTKVSTKNKSQTEVTREIIQNMMSLLGVEELEPNTGKNSKESDSMCENGEKRANSAASTHHLGTDGYQKGEMQHTEHQERTLRNEQEGCYNIRKGSQASEKDYGHSRKLGEKEHRKREKKFDSIKLCREAHDTNYHSKYRDKRYASDRELHDSRDGRRKKYRDEVEYQCYEQKEMRVENIRGKTERHRGERRYHRQEYAPKKSRRTEESDSEDNKSEKGGTWKRKAEYERENKLRRRESKVSVND